MTTKKKLPITEESSTTARPRLLGLAVLVSAAASSWYWYRPLPNESSEGILAPATLSRIVDGQRTLIEPNTNDSSNSNASIVPVYSALPEDLVGDRQVQLRPFQPMPQGTPQERLAKEPLPVVPISRPDRTRSDQQAAMVASRPPLWSTQDSMHTPENPSVFGQSVASRSGAALNSTGLNSNGLKRSDWDTPSPFGGNGQPANAESSNLLGDRIVAIANPKAPPTGWPDASYKPESSLAQSRVVSNPPNPPLTIRSGNSPAVAQSSPAQAGKIGQTGKIVLADNRPDAGGESLSKRTVPTSWSSGSLPSGNGAMSEPTQPAKKSGAVIRQPKQ